MNIIDHFEIKVVHFKACKKFYETVMPALNIELKWSDDLAAGFGRVGSNKVCFMIEKHDKSVPAHIAFSAENKKAVQQFHQLGIQNGFQCNGKPGLRKEYAPNYYAAFLLDPEGKNIEAVISI